MQSRIDRKEFGRIAKEFGIPESEVRRIVVSFFDVVSLEAKALPFDNERRIYKRDKFNEYASCYSIPYVGRIGPVYSRYVKWRSNEAESFDMRPRSDYRYRMTQDEIEHIAEDVLSGNAPPDLKKKRGKDKFNRVWVVGENGKRQAWQVIPKTR